MSSSTCFCPPDPLVRSKLTRNVKFCIFKTGNLRDVNVRGIPATVNVALFVVVIWKGLLPLINHFLILLLDGLSDPRRWCWTAYGVSETKGQICVELFCGLDLQRCCYMSILDCVLKVVTLDRSFLELLMGIHWTRVQVGYAPVRRWSQRWCNRRLNQNIDVVVHQFTCWQNV